MTIQLARPAILDSRAVQRVFDRRPPLHPVRSERPFRFQDFKSFLLTQLPYGQIDASRLFHGGAEWAGIERINQPDWVRIATDPDTYNMIKHWQFGNKTYAMAKAVRIQFTYAAPYAELVTGSLLIGYQAPPLYSHTQTSLDALPDLRNDELRKREARDARANRIDAMNGHDDHHHGNYMQVELEEALVKEINNQSLALTQPLGDDPNDCDALIIRNSPYTADVNAIKHLMDPFMRPTAIEFCGIARDNYVLDAYTDTWPTVAADPAKYEQLMHWNFGERSFRITKAIRLEYLSMAQIDNDELPPALLIGYQGPGPY